jgi:hypothetical protein
VSNESSVGSGEAIAEGQTGKPTVRLEAAVTAILRIIVDERATVQMRAELARIGNGPR